jgi:FtsH-binding integral membrane protein
MALFASLTLLLVVLKADKEYVMASFGLTGQLVAALMTYVNSNKPNVPISDMIEDKDKNKIA